MEKPNTRSQWLFVAVIALLIALYVGRGLFALIDGQMWIAPKNSPPRLMTGSASALMGAATIGLGLIVAAALANYLNAGRRIWASMGALGVVCALVCGVGAFLVP